MAAAIVNGVAYGWVNVTFMGYNVPLIGITEISYKKKQKKENIYATGPDPGWRGYGNNEYESSISLLFDNWVNIIDAAAGNPLGVPFADMQVVFGSDRLNTRTDVLQAAEWLEDSMETKQGDTHIIIKVPMIIGGIIHKVG